MTLQVGVLELPPIGTNCYVVGPAGGDEVVVIDPGGAPERVQTAVAERGARVVEILVTHSHWDHVGAVATLAKQWSVPVAIGRMEAPVLADLPRFAPAEFGPWQSHTAERLLDGGEVLELAGMQFEVFAIPGHSPATMGFYCAEPEPVLFCGDLIFAGSVGRTDLPFADHATLLESCSMLIASLPPQTKLYSGHGPMTTLQRERDSNPFLRELV